MWSKYYPLSPSLPSSPKQKKYILLLQMLDLLYYPIFVYVLWSQSKKTRQMARPGALYFKSNATHKCCKHSFSFFFGPNKQSFGQKAFPLTFIGAMLNLVCTFKYYWSHNKSISIGYKTNLLTGRVELHVKLRCIIYVSIYRRILSTD
jgi:hypothetical protein